MWIGVELMGHRLKYMLDDCDLCGAQSRFSSVIVPRGG